MLKNMKKTNVSTTSLAKNAEKYEENKCQYNITGQKCGKISRKHMSVQDHNHWSEMVNQMSVQQYITGQNVNSNKCHIYIIMWSCQGNMPKYYPGLRDILPDRTGGQYVCQTWVYWHITWIRPH